MKKLLFTILALAALPGLVSANIMNTGVELGYSKMGGDNYPSDSHFAYSLFSEINTTSLTNLYFGAELSMLGTMGVDDGYGKDTWAVYQAGAYTKLNLFEIPYGSAKIVGNIKFGYAGYVTRVDKNGDGYAIDSDGSGYNIGFGVSYLLNQGTSLTLSYASHNYEQKDDDGHKIDNCKIKVFGISLSQRFGYSPKRNVRATENNVYEQVEQKASSKNTVIADPCDGLCPKTVPASVLNLNYNNQW